MANKKIMAFLVVLILLILAAGIYLVVAGSGTSTNSTNENSSCVECGATNESGSLNKSTATSINKENGSSTNPSCCT